MVGHLNEEKLTRCRGLWNSSLPASGTRGYDEIYLRQIGKQVGPAKILGKCRRRLQIPCGISIFECRERVIKMKTEG